MDFYDNLISAEDTSKYCGKIKPNLDLMYASICRDVLSDLDEHRRFRRDKVVDQR